MPFFCIGGLENWQNFITPSPFLNGIVPSVFLRKKVLTGKNFLYILSYLREIILRVLFSKRINRLIEGPSHFSLNLEHSL